MPASVSSNVKDTWVYRYALACVITLSFTVLGRVVYSAVSYNPILFIITGVIVAAWVGGVGPGILSSLIAALAVRPLFSKQVSFDYGVQDLVRLFFFMALASLVCYLVGARRKAESQLRESNADLDRRVHQRTAELAETNRELREANEQLALERARVEAANEELRRVNHDLEQFAYSASHDLREPIRNIAVYSQLIDRRYAGVLDENGRSYLRFISDGAQRMDRLLNGLLTYSKAVGSDTAVTAPVESDQALNGALADLAEAIRDSGANIVRDDSLPPVWVSETHLQQLFQNIVGNAIKYRSDDAPVVRISHQVEDGWCRFAIEDNGIGIDPRYSERVFGLFQRLHDDGKYPGTGIGLAICQRLVQRYGGRIWVDAGSPKGAVFCFTVPSADGRRPADSTFSRPIGE